MPSHGLRAKWTTRNCHFTSRVSLPFLFFFFRWMEMISWLRSGSFQIRFWPPAKARHRPQLAATGHISNTMPSPITVPVLKSILSWHCSWSRSSEQSGILPVPQGRVSAKLLQRLSGPHSSFYVQRALGQETKLNENPGWKLSNFLCLSEVMHKSSPCAKQSSANIFLFYSFFFFF